MADELFIATQLLVIGGLGLLVWLCYRLIDAHTRTIRSIEEALHAYQSTSLAASTLFQELAAEVWKSYQLVASKYEVMASCLEQATESATQACERNVARMAEATQASTAVATTTCHELLQSAFPDERLNFSWHAANSFMCYYCQHRFPLTELEQLGPYKYCKEHGLARQKCSSS